jgi:FkbM family methyltransferase
MHASVIQAIREETHRKDLAALRELGMTVDASDGPGRWTLDAFGANALAGEFDRVDQLVEPDAACVDLGANVGMWSCKLAPRCQAVLAVEPVAGEGWLDRALPPNVRLARCAVGRETGEAEIHIPLARSGGEQHGLASLCDLAPLGYTDCLARAVPVRTLDDLVAEHLPGRRVGFIKIDVEGWELEALAGGAGVIAEHRPRLWVEIWPPCMPDHGRAIEAMGYRGVFWFDGRMHDLSAFEKAVHCAPENDWDPRDPSRFRPELHVNNFCFLPTG